MGPGYEWLKTDPRTIDLAASCKSENVNLVHDALEGWVMSQDSVEEAERKLDETGIPCSRVKSIEELATTDSHIGAREMRIPMLQPFLGPVMMYGSPLKFSETLPPSGDTPLSWESTIGKSSRRYWDIQKRRSTHFIRKTLFIRARKWRNYRRN